MLSTAILLMIFLGGAATGMKHHLQLSGRGGRLSSHGSATTHLPGPFSIDFLSCRWNFRNRHQDQTQFVTFSTAKLNWSLHTGMLHLVDCAKGTNDMTINAEDIKRITYTGVSAKKPAKKDEPNRKTLLWTVQSAEKCGARPELARRLRSLLQGMFRL